MNPDQIQAEIEEKVEDICKMLESSNGYIQITSMPKPVMNNIEPVIKSKTTFDVEIFDRTSITGTLRGDEYGFETLKMAQDYINDHPRSTEQYRIIQRDVTVKTSVV